MIDEKDLDAWERDISDKVSSAKELQSKNDEAHDKAAELARGIIGEFVSQLKNRGYRVESHGLDGQTGNEFSFRVFFTDGHYCGLRVHQKELGYYAAKREGGEFFSFGNGRLGAAFDESKCHDQIKSFLTSVSREVAEHGGLQQQ